jgi:hypothetical protein
MQDVGFHVVAAGGLALGCAIRVLVDVPTCFVPLAIFHFVVLLSVV